MKQWRLKSLRSWLRSVWVSSERFIYNFNQISNMDKVKVQLDKDVVNELIKLKRVGDSYSDVIRRLLEKRGENL